MGNRAVAGEREPGGWALLGPAIVACAFAALALWTWRRLGDVQVDFGHQLYIPWRLAEGDRLYEDIAWGYGPLSQYANALLFRTFGASLTTLLVANLTLLAGMVAALYWILKGVAGRPAAVVGSIVTLVTFGFAHFIENGNYNFVAPYAHEATHGTLLCVIALGGLRLALLDRRDSGFWVAGVALGLSLFTKPEFPVALVPTVVAPIVLLGARGGTVPWAQLGRVAGGAFGAVALVVVLLIPALGLAESLASLWAPWRPLFVTEYSQASFFRNQMGMDAPVEAGLVVLEKAGATIAWVLAWVLLAARLAVPSRLRWLWLAAIALASGIATFWLLRQLDFATLGRGLPLLIVLALAPIGAVLLRGGHDLGEGERRSLFLISLGILSLAFLGKILLIARFWHYGFYLALPGTLLLVAFLMDWLPRRVPGRSGGAVLQALAAGGLLGFACIHLERTAVYVELRDTPFGAGGDRILTFDHRRRPRYRVFSHALARLKQHAPPGSTAVVMPYGIMFNYQSRTVNPTPYIRFTNIDFALHGEAEMIEALDRTPPGVLLILHADPEPGILDDWGRGPDQGAELLGWVNRHYRRKERIGARPFAGRNFGADVLVRIEPAEPTAD